MRITIDRRTLAEAIGDVIPFCPSRTPSAVLNYVKFSAEGDGISMSAYDGMHHIIRHVRTKERDMGPDFLAECDVIGKLLALTHCDDITLEQTESTLRIVHPGGAASLRCLSAAEFPSPPSPDEDAPVITLPSSVLADAIETGRNFVGADDLRPMLKTIYAYVDGSDFGFCATDTRRLVCCHGRVREEDGGPAHWLIEPGVFGPLSRACDVNGSVEIAAGRSHVSYTFGDRRIVTAQTRGAYPDFRRVIPKDCPVECAVEAGDILGALSRASLMAEASRLAEISIGRTDMTVTAYNRELLRSGEENIQHNGCDGEIAFSVNCDSFRHCIKACGPGGIVMRLKDASSPVLLQTPSRPALTVLQMPMSVSVYG